MPLNIAEQDNTNNPPSFILSFHNLTYTLKPPPSIPFNYLFRRNHSPRPRRILLDSVSGQARDSEILAIIGPTGSGKSTLIDALANPISKSSLTNNNIFLNGQPFQSKIQKKISSYVMQHDLLLFPMLTVEETLTFAAEFRLPNSLCGTKKRARVQTLIDQLGLRDAARTIIGDQDHRGISGGERRRVSIGTDIIHDPILVFLDEPTSGLDSTSAFMVMKVLQRIASSGSIVVTSIHQPSARILGFIDRMLILSKGRTVFFGSPNRMVEFFCDFGREMSEGENWAEFALDVVREVEDGADGGDELVKFFGLRSEELSICEMLDFCSNRVSSSTLTLQAAIAASINRGKLFSANVFEAKQFANPFHVELSILTRRAFTNTWRAPDLFLTRLASILLTATIFATFFLHLDSSPRGIQERFAFFALSMSTIYYTCTDSLPISLQNLHIFLRETSYNSYRRISYVLSDSVIALPSHFLLSLTFASVTFSLVRLANGYSGFLFYFYIILASFWAGSGFVTFFSSIVSRVMLGYFAVVAMLGYFLLFSGFFINRERIPEYWIWFHYISLVKYSYEGILQSEFGGDGKCFVRGVEMFQSMPFWQMSVEMKERALVAVGRELGVRISTDTCLVTGMDVMKQNGVMQVGKWGCLGVIVGWGFLFRILFYVSLLIRGRNKRM